MEELGMYLTLCTLLTLGRAVPINGSASGVSRHMGLCEYVRQHSSNLIGAFVPQCDPHGNFLPQQCSGSTGYCWCVDVITGEEIPNTRTLPGTIPVNCDKEIYCPYGWSRFGERCFIFIDSPKSWAEAEGYCLFEGANLASIHSYEESHFIQDLTREYTHDFPESWIGGHDAIHDCFWMWSDGSRFNYENWFKDYVMERTEHCLKMNYGCRTRIGVITKLYRSQLDQDKSYTYVDNEWKWNYASCNETLPFVCAKRV